MPLKIGVLVPNSNYLPCLGQDILQALEMGLAEHEGVDYELLVEPAGYNADRLVVIAKIQELLLKHRVDIVTAPLNAGLLEQVKHFFSGQQIPLIVNTLGEDVVSQEGQDPYVFVNSLNLWQSSWMAGYWGTATYGKRACSIAALHDGGYGMGFSFALGLEAQEGALLQAAVTHRQSRAEDPTEIIESVAENNPDFIMGLYAGKEALSFLNAYHKLGYRDRFPLIGLPFMVDETLLDELGPLALGIRSVYGWRGDTDEDRRFTHEFRVRTGRPINGYVLMAYETGHLIAGAVRQMGSAKSVGEQLAAALPTVAVQGPRGTIRFDPESRQVATTDYLREVVEGKEGRLVNQVIAVLETPPLFYEQLKLAQKNLTKQGWLNPYLVA